VRKEHILGWNPINKMLVEIGRLRIAGVGLMVNRVQRSMGGIKQSSTHLFDECIVMKKMTQARKAFYKGRTGYFT